MTVAEARDNHCAVCVDIEIKRSAERKTAQRLAAIAVWREDAVSDEVWAEAARHYDEPQLASLVLYIAITNVWNRLHVATRQVAGA